LRILKLSDVYFPRVNGVSTSIHTFRQSLHDLGHETLLLAPEYRGQEQREEQGVRRAASPSASAGPSTPWSCPPGPCWRCCGGTASRRAPR